MTTFTPDELARTLFTNDGVCSQYDWDNANEIARQWYRSLARAILPIVNARLDAVTKERDELRAKTLKVENCILCADECRGHSLGDSAAWEPEEGSRDWLNFHLVAAQPARGHRQFIGTAAPRVVDNQAEAIRLRDAERARRALWAECERRPIAFDLGEG